MLHERAEREQVEGDARELVAQLVVELGELRHHDREHEDHQPANQGEQHARVDERRNQLLAERERNALEVDVALHHFLQVAGSLAGQQGGGVHDRDAALGLEGSREAFAGLDAVGHVFKLRREVAVFLRLAQHLDGAQDGQAGADQGQKLLIEDEELFELDLAAGGAAETAAGLYGEHVVPGMGEAGAELLGGGRGLHLLHDSAAFIGQFYDKLCHALIPGSPDSYDGLLDP